MRDHDYGSFGISSPWVDEVRTDDRINGVLETRAGGLLASPLKWKAGRPGRKAQKICDEIGGTDESVGLWDSIASPATIKDMLGWGNMLGVAIAQITWQTVEGKWVPRVIPWHPHTTRWDWMRRRFVTQTMDAMEVELPRPDQLPNGDANWFVWCPHGVEYGWRRALVRVLSYAYLMRQWNARDWARYNERHGLAIINGKVPQEAPQAEKDAFFTTLAGIGSEAAVMSPQGGEGQPSFDVELIEAKSKTWDTFEAFKKQLDVDIAIAVLGQNLTTEVQEGSRAAAGVQNLIRIDKMAEDALITTALRQQVLWHYARFNYRDPELAPQPSYQIFPPDDELKEAQTLQSLGTGAQALMVAEPRTDVAAIFEKYGVPMISEEEMAARQAQEEEEAAARLEQQQAAGGDDGAAGEEDPEKDPAKAKTAALTSTGVRARRTFAGLPIAIENPAGSIRQWPGGSTRMLFDYGFIEGHLSGDGEELDVYLGPEEAPSHVYVVHQMKAPEYRGHDEDKVMLGWPDAESARAAYLAHRNDGEKAFGGMSVIPLGRFASKLRRRGPESTAKIRASIGDTVHALMRLVDRADDTVALRRTITGNSRAAKYQERLVTRSKALAARALAPDLAVIKAEIEKATSFEDLRERITRAFRGMDPARLARVLDKATILAHLAGKKSAIDAI